MNRRTFLGASVAGLAGAALGMSAPVPSSPSPAGRGGQGGRTLNLGVASYSLRNFPRDKAIEMVKALGTPYVNLKSVHLPFELSPEQLAAARREIEAAGLVIVGGGVITFDEDTDPGVEKYFAYAKAAGMPLIAIHTDPKLLPRIERFAKQYDIKVAIHNHGPEDKHFPSPYDALKHILSSVEVASGLGSRDLSLWFADGSNYPGTGTPPTFSDDPSPRMITRRDCPGFPTTMKPAIATWSPVPTVARVEIFTSRGSTTLSIHATCEEIREA